MANASFAGQSDDVEAIYNYMKNAVPKTTEASTIRSQFLDWYLKAGWWDKTQSSSWYDEARTRRNQFNLKNATTPAQVSQVQAVLAKGITTEQMEGKSRPTINIKTGAVGSQVKNPTTPGGALKRNLKLGVNGDDVKTWQSFLGLTPPTGYFDKPTDAKTRAWQKSNGLTADGIVGPKSWGKAFAAEPAPFATPSVTSAVASIAQAFKAPQSTPTPAAAFSPPAAKHETPHTSTAKKQSTKAETPLTVEASMLPDLSKIPLWAKITGGAAMVAAAVFGVKHFEKQM